jgi:hypothetical protein
MLRATMSTGVEPVVQTVGATEGERNDGRFKKGNPGPKKLLDRKDGQEAAMEWVLTNQKDETHEQAVMRNWLKEDARGFMARWNEIERARAAAPGEKTEGPEPPTPPEPDPTEQVCMELIDKLIASYQETP